MNLRSARDRATVVDAAIVKFKPPKKRNQAAEALAPIHEWFDWFEQIERTTSVRFSFEEGFNVEAPRFTNLEARVHLHHDILPLPGFLRFVTGDAFGTRGHTIGITDSWVSRSSADVIYPYPASLKLPSPVPSTLIGIPSSFKLDDRSTHPGFQTIGVAFLGAKTATAWGQAGNVVGPRCLLTWIQVLNALLVAPPELAVSATGPPLTVALPLLAEPDADDLVSVPSQDDGDVSESEDDAESTAPSAGAGLQHVVLPGPWSPADHRPGQHMRDYMLAVKGLPELAMAAFSTPAAAAASGAGQEQQPLLTHPMAVPAADAYRPSISRFSNFLIGMYTDPIPERSAEFAARLSRYELSRDTFQEIRDALFEEVTGHVIRHPPWTSNAQYPPRPAVTLVTRSFIVAVEAKLLEMIALRDMEGDLTPGKAILIVYISDGAGRRVHLAKVAAGFFLLCVHSRLGHMRALVPAWLHGGPYAAVHHRTMMAHDAIGSQLEQLAAAKLLGKYPVVLRCFTDIAEASLLYSPPSYYGPGGICWLQTAKLGYYFISRAGCGCCSQTGLEIFSIPKGGPPQTDVETRAVPPVVRGRDTLDLPWWWGSTHAVGHGVMCLVASVGVDMPEDMKEAREFFARVFPGLGWNIYRDPLRAAKLQSLRAAITKRRRGEQILPGDTPEDLDAEIEAADVAGRADPANGPSAGAKGASSWESRSVPHSCRMKESRGFLDNDEVIATAAAFCDKRPPIVDPVDPSQPAVPLGEYFREGVAYLRARRYVTRYVDSKNVRRWRWRGRRVFHLMKALAARTHPWRGREVMPTVPWFADSSAEVKAALLAQLDAIPYDQQASCVAMAAHQCFEHGFDHLVEDGVPFDQAARLVEEAADHMFSYLYYTVPALQPSVPHLLSGKVRAIWQVMQEASFALVPRQTGPLASRIETNRAYV